MKTTIELIASAIKKVVEVEGIAADHFKEEEERIQKESIYLTEELDRLIRTEELIEKRHNNKNLQQDREARKDYANKTFILTCVWGLLIFVIIFSIAKGSFIFYDKWNFKLSDKVLITLITSTTVNFFGFFLLVMKYLFHTKPPEKSKRKKEIK